MSDAYSNDELLEALEECVKLQRHYAELLNMHDGGKRIPFTTAQAFLERMRHLKQAKP